MSKNNHKPKQIVVSDAGRGSDATKVPVQTSFDFTPQHEQRLHFYSHLSSTAVQMPTGRVSRRRMLDEQEEEEPVQPKAQIVDTASLSQIDTIATAGIHDLRVSMDGILPRQRIAPDYHLPHRYEVLAKHYSKQTQQLAATITNGAVHMYKSIPRISNPVAKLKRLAIAVVIIAMILGVGFIGFRTISGMSQPSTPAASSESFERAKSQWECSLQEYEASIGKVSSTNKESSCLNQK